MTGRLYLIWHFCVATGILVVAPAHADVAAAVRFKASIIAMAERPTAEAVRQRLERDVPLGTARADAIRWLESNKIIFVIGDGHGGLDPDGKVIVGFIGDPRKNVIVSTDVRFKLYFSEEHELVRMELEEIYTGP